jgi:hypothetical protein
MRFKFLILSILITGVSATLVPWHSIAHAQGFGTCYDQSGANVGPVNFNLYKQTGCPVGSAPVTNKGAGGQIVNNNLSYTPLEPLSANGNKGPINFCDFINLIFRVFIYVGAMVAVLFLVLGGIGYMISEVVNKRLVAKKRIQASIYGLLILLCSYLILNTVNPQLVKSCSVVAATQTGVYFPNAPDPTAPGLKQVIVTPNQPIPGTGNSTIEQIVNKEVVKDSLGNALTLTINTVGGDPQKISDFRQSCTSQSGEMRTVSGTQLNQPPSVTVYVCTVK